MNLVDSRIVIVGAGHAGGRAAETLRSAGHRGSITLVGKELHPPYQRPPLSKEVLDGDVDATNTYLHSLDFYEHADIRLVLGAEAAAIDCASGRVLLDSHKELPYDILLLTTGARARRLSIPCPDGANVHYLRDIEDALILRRRLVSGARLAIIGAGFIGLEVAAAARKRGCEVTLIELAMQPLQRVAPPGIGSFFAALHQRKG
ncbi:MAG: NAD(P)/FAD-dependent oxidoreductase, partial [Terriglobia bacterium]